MQQQDFFTLIAHSCRISGQKALNAPTDKWKLWWGLSQKFGLNLINFTRVVKVKRWILGCLVCGFSCGRLAVPQPAHQCAALRVGANKIRARLGRKRFCGSSWAAICLRNPPRCLANYQHQPLRKNDEALVLQFGVWHNEQEFCNLLISQIRPGLFCFCRQINAL